MKSLGEEVKSTKVKDHSTAATSAVTSDSVDMTGFRNVKFTTSFGTANANNTVKIQQSSDDSTFADLAGTSTASGTSDEDVWVEILSPGKRYLRAVIAGGTSSDSQGSGGATNGDG